MNVIFVTQMKCTHWIALGCSLMSSLLELLFCPQHGLLALLWTHWGAAVAAVAVLRFRRGV